MRSKEKDIVMECVKAVGAGRNGRLGMPGHLGIALGFQSSRSPSLLLFFIEVDLVPAFD